MRNNACEETNACIARWIKDPDHQFHIEKKKIEASPWIGIRVPQRRKASPKRLPDIVVVVRYARKGFSATS